MSDLNESLWRRVQLMIRRGRVTSGNDAGNVQKLQVQLGSLEIGDDRPRLAEYGFTSFPQDGCDAVVVFIAGDQSKGIVIATGDQSYRLHLERGEVAIHDDQGQKVHLTRSGIVVDGGGLPVTIQNAPTISATATAAISLTAPVINLNGAINQAAASSGGSTAAHFIGPVTVETDVTAGNISLKTHKTSGIQPGSGTSGVPTP